MLHPSLALVPLYVSCPGSIPDSKHSDIRLGEKLRGGGFRAFMINSARRSQPKGTRSVLPNNQACLTCRNGKKVCECLHFVHTSHVKDYQTIYVQKCDTKLPRCTRCERRNLPCHSQVVFPRRQRIDLYQERVLDLESKLALISKTHTRGLISQSLWEKINLLNDRFSAQAGLQVPSQHLALWPFTTNPITAAPVHNSGKVTDEELEAGFAPSIPRDAAGQMIKTYTPSFDGRPLPTPLSLWMYVQYPGASIR